MFHGAIKEDFWMWGKGEWVLNSNPWVTEKNNLKSTAYKKDRRIYT